MNETFIPYIMEYSFNRRTKVIRIEKGNFLDITPLGFPIYIYYVEIQEIN